MSLILQDSAVKKGLQSDSALLLSTLLWITNGSVFTPPVEVADIRSAVEDSQPSGYMSDDGFNQYLTRLFALPLVDASLSDGERTILNTIRFYLDPPPFSACCGLGGGVNPSLTNSSIALNKKLGTSTYEHELLIKTSDVVTCDVFDIEVIIAPVAAEPVATVTGVTCNLLGCVVDSTHWQKLWIDFVGNPTGGSYTFTAQFRDVLGATIETLVFPFTFP